MNVGGDTIQPIIEGEPEEKRDGDKKNYLKFAMEIFST